MAEADESYVIRPSEKKAEEWAAQLAIEPDMKRLQSSRSESAERATAAGQNTKALRAEQVRLQTALETERLALDREKTRRRIAYGLIGTLIALVVGTIGYIVWLTPVGGLSTEVGFRLGTTLLAPIVGLIGAVIGFHYGKQTATEAASAAAKNAATPLATQLATQTATEAASEAARQVATEVAREAAGQDPPEAENR